MGEARTRSLDFQTTSILPTPVLSTSSQGAGVSDTTVSLTHTSGEQCWQREQVLSMLTAITLVHTALISTSAKTTVP